MSSLIKYLNLNDVNVTLLLPLFHPDLYELMKRTKPVFVTVENIFREIAFKHNIQILGSYDPSKIGSNAD